MHFFRRVDWVNATMMSIACAWVAFCYWFVTSAFVNYLTR